MQVLLSPLNKKSERLLCDQIREQISLLIARGVLQPGMRLPSSRKLAQQLKVSTNTVVNAYQSLVVDRLIEARARSGYFVHSSLANTQANVSAHKNSPTRHFKLFDAIGARPHFTAGLGVQRPDNWSEYPFPFVCNQMDAKRFPLADWRACCYQVAGAQQVLTVNSDYLSADPAGLAEQIRTHLLPQQGIWAQENEIMLTAGAQHGLFMLALLLGKGRRLAIEDPCYPDARAIFQRYFDAIVPVDVDDKGIEVDERLDNCDAVYVTSTHQYPSSVRMALARKKALLKKAEDQNLVIIEDGYDSETDFYPHASPALRAMPGGERVIYTGTLSKSLSPGLRIGFMVAAPDLIEEASVLRGLMIRHLPPLLQLAAAKFLREGHHDAHMVKLQRIYRRRWQLASAALKRYFPDVPVAPGEGGTNFYLSLPHSGMPVDELIPAALERGIVLENISACFHNPEQGRYQLRLGVSAISAHKIAEGVRLLKAVLGSK